MATHQRALLLKITTEKNLSLSTQKKISQVNRLWNGGNGKGTVKLYRGKRLIDEVICENVGCEYGEYDSE